jgi:hypothetical protein
MAWSASAANPIHQPVATASTLVSAQVVSNAAPTNRAIEPSPETLIARYTYWLAVFTAILAIVSAVEIYYLVRTDKTARLSAEAARKSAESLPRIERAYLLVDRISFSSGSGQIMAQLRFKNFGKTPAIVTKYQNNFTAILPEAPEYPPDLAPREQVVEAYGFLQAPESVYLGTNQLLNFYGMITYQDIFKIMHATRFCFIVQLGGSPPFRSGGDAYNGYD